MTFSHLALVGAGGGRATCRGHPVILAEEEEQDGQLVSMGLIIINLSGTHSIAVGRAAPRRVLSSPAHDVP